MNKVETHETEYTCNVCGSDVVAEWGRHRCGDFDCPTNDRDNYLTWNSTDEDIEAHRDEEPSLEEQLIEAEREYKGNPNGNPLNYKVVGGPNSRKEIEDRDLFLESLAREFLVLAEFDRDAGRKKKASAYASMANTLRAHKKRRGAGRV